MDFNVVFYEEFKHIEVEIGGKTIRTDQPVEKGGTGVGPTPGAYLYAAVASCTASTAYGYCHKNGLPLPTGMSVHVDEADDENLSSDPGKMIFEIHLPADFPENRLAAVQKAADACWVKQRWLNPPEFETTVLKE
jgi:uncharacterized OsmC-like protein